MIRQEPKAHGPFLGSIANQKPSIFEFETQQEMSSWRWTVNRILNEHPKFM
jgi:hypothetical protein